MFDSEFLYWRRNHFKGHEALPHSVGRFPDSNLAARVDIRGCRGRVDFKSSKEDKVRKYLGGKSALDERGHSLNLPPQLGQPEGCDGTLSHVGRETSYDNQRPAAGFGDGGL